MTSQRSEDKASVQNALARTHHHHHHHHHQHHHHHHFTRRFDSEKVLVVRTETTHLSDDSEASKLHGSCCTLGHAKHSGNLKIAYDPYANL